MQSACVERWNEKQVHYWLSHLDECQVCTDNLKFLLETCQIDETKESHNEQFNELPTNTTHSPSTLSSFKEMIPFFKYHALLGIDLLELTLDELFSIFFNEENQEENEDEIIDIPSNCNIEDESTKLLIHKLYYHLCILKFNNQNSVNNIRQTFNYCTECIDSRVNSRIH